jgi:hypothetical protein
MRRKGLLGGYEVGLQFVNLDPAARHALACLAEFGFFRAESAGQATYGGGGFGGAGGGGGRSAVRADMTLPDYYETLGVAREASESEIRARRLARQYHPDVAGPDADQQRFIEINQAYETLIDPARRKRFDLSLVG